MSIKSSLLRAGYKKSKIILNNDIQSYDKSNYIMYQVPGDGLCMLHAFLCAILDGEYISILDKPVYKN